MIKAYTYLKKVEVVEMVEDYIEFELKHGRFELRERAVRDGYRYLGEFYATAVYLDPFEGELIIATGWHGETRGSKRYVYKFKEDELEKIREICKPHGYPHIKKNYIKAFEIKMMR